MNTCPFCREPVLEGEEARGHTPPAHEECVFRAVVGSVAHVQRRCSCYVYGSTEGDPEGMTPREAARAALELYLTYQRFGIDPLASVGAQQWNN